MLRSFSLGLALTCPLLLGAGCGGVQCKPCSGIAIAIHVVDAATQQPILDATVKADGMRCDPNPPANANNGVHSCPGGVGKHEVTVVAPGYAPQTLTVELVAEKDPGECSCGPQTSAVVKLSPFV